MRRTKPLPPFEPDVVARRILRHGPRALAHMDALRRPFTFKEYPVDYTVRRLIHRGLVLVIPYLGVDCLVNSAAVNVALRRLRS